MTTLVRKITIACCFLLLLFLPLTLCSCEDNAAKEAKLNGPGIFEAGGMEWAGPYLNFSGSKPAEMEFEAWTFYTTMSPACRGASILQSDDTNWFSPGGAEGAKMGVAKKAYFVLPGQEEYALAIPVGINDARGCDWHLSELRIYAWHPHTSKDPARSGMRERSRNDLLLFAFSGEIPLPDLPDGYEIMCLRQRYDKPNFVMNNLKCRYPEQTQQYTHIDAGALQTDRNVCVNVCVSEEVEVINK